MSDSFAGPDARSANWEILHVYPPNYDSGRLRRRARRSAALDRQGSILSRLLSLEWPFCAVGAVLVTAAMIITAPIRALTGPPPLYYSGYYGQPYYPPPAYYPPRYYAPPYNYGSH